MVHITNQTDSFGVNTHQPTLQQTKVLTVVPGSPLCPIGPANREN